MSYLIAALQQIDPAIGQTAQEMLCSGQSPHPEALLAIIINDIVSISIPFLLVLDDCHVIEAQPIHNTLGLLLEQLPPSMHLVITCRADPPLHLSRLRGRGQLTELHAADLRFTAEEVGTFLNQVMDLDLTTDDIAALDLRTEGWIAGLQLAALALQATLSRTEQGDPAQFISAFADNDRYILDYLADEVLDRRPQGTKTFLLQTSILNRLNGSLCDAVTDQAGGQKTLERLEAANLFIAPLDNRREWYRYHPLFAGLLKQRLHQEFPDQLPKLYHRASRWFEEEGLIDEAIQHALVAEDFERAATLIEQHVTTILWLSSDIRTSWGWIEALPEPLFKTRPQLCVIKAWMMFLLFSSREEEIEALLQKAEQSISKLGSEIGERQGVDTEEAAIDDSQFDITRDLLAGIDHLRANLARLRGDVEEAIDLSQRALKRLPEGNLLPRIGAKINLAAAYDSLGLVTKAAATYRESIVLSRKVEFNYAVLYASAKLIDVLQIQGQLRQANRIFQQIEPALKQRPGPAAGMVYISVGELLRERNQLERAESHFRRGIELCRPFDAWAETTRKGLFGLARIFQARGRLW